MGYIAVIILRHSPHTSPEGCSLAPKNGFYHIIL